MPPMDYDRRESVASGWGMSLTQAVVPKDSFYDPRAGPPHG